MNGAPFRTHDVAAECEQLRAENAQLRTHLSTILCGYVGLPFGSPCPACRVPPAATVSVDRTHVPARRGFLWWRARPAHNRMKCAACGARWTEQPATHADRMIAEIEAHLERTRGILARFGTAKSVKGA